MKKVINKCIHTFKCMFNPGGKSCVKQSKNELNKMSKIELELLGRKHNIELDRREKKSTLVKEIFNVLQSK